MEAELSQLARDRAVEAGLGPCPRGHYGVRGRRRALRLQEATRSKIAKSRRCVGKMAREGMLVEIDINIIEINIHFFVQQMC